MENSAKWERLTDNLTLGRMWSYFKERPVILTYVLLALSFILVTILFVVVHTQHFKPEMKELARKDDILGLNITVNSLGEKMKEMERTSKKKNSCEVGWHLFNGNCYFFSDIKSNWYKARTMCVHRSADLVVINNENEQKFIAGVTGSKLYWIGLSDTEDEGKWTWVDGKEYESAYKSWMPGEPNSAGDEDCAQVWKEGKWNDKVCHDTNPFSICEKKL
ncbi:hypothetical protein GDO81_009021 [Engystomops pustulosus]|uniref:C-type lectin domain-containing protein n=1 Tax=Engystomops pustulosus TaxID=76066 RepID=A0AAV7BN48_ENGPU|nr:hypothetical protein GDO81_009021 [Engystomops pustulosus]